MEVGPTIEGFKVLFSDLRVCAVGLRDGID
jgi:hypothetical protein